LPKHWFDELPHTHVALDDAVEQGALFCNMLAELRTQRALLASLKPAGETLDNTDAEGQNAQSGR
jgi:hypothetical protein